MVKRGDIQESEWTDSIISLMRLRVPPDGVEAWPDKETIESATRLAMRLSSMDMLPPENVKVDELGAVQFVWSLSGYTRIAEVFDGDCVRFAVRRPDGESSYSCPLDKAANFNDAVYYWLERWINSLSGV
jgi:hypothetical protein